MFCSFDPGRQLPILSIPGVLHVVGLGRVPTPIEPAEIEWIRAVLASGVPVQPWPFLEIGELVAIKGGPLAGLEGYVIDFKGSYRLVLSIRLLQRSIAAELQRSWVRPIS